MKYFAIAKIVDPVEVSTRASTMGQTAHEGAIFAECPELGFVGGDLIYCRYGMSIPYIRVQAEDQIWIEPTSGTKERFIYVGFADCAGTETPETGDELIITLATNVAVKITNTPKSLLLDVNGVKLQIDESGGKVTIICDELLLGGDSVTEAFILGDTAKTEFDKDKNAMAELQTAINNWTVVPNDGGGALKALLGTFSSMSMADYSNILSTKIKGE